MTIMPKNAQSILIELLKKPSITPKSAGCYEIISDILTQIGFNTSIYNHRGSNYDVENFFARLGNKKPLLCFAGHVDVVPPNDEKWQVENISYDPFSAKKIGTRVYGRGACDMKSGIAAFLFAISRFVTKNPSFNQIGSLGVLLTSDEEGDAEAGMKALVEELSKVDPFKFDACIMAEPTSRQFVGDFIKVGRRGSLFGKLTIFGKQGHIAYPDQALNPITILAKIIHEIKKINIDKESKPLLPKSQAELKAEYQLSNLEFYNINCQNITKNIIPSEIEASFNIRYSPKTNDKIIDKLLNDRIQKVIKKSGYSLELNTASQPFYGANDDLISLVKSVSKEISSRSLVETTTGGSSDSRFLYKSGPIVDFGLIGDSMHKKNEFVELADVESLSDIYLAIIERFFKTVSK